MFPQRLHQDHTNGNTFREPMVSVLLAITARVMDQGNCNLNQTEEPLIA